MKKEGLPAFSSYSVLRQESSVSLSGAGSSELNYHGP